MSLVRDGTNCIYCDLWWIFVLHSGCLGLFLSCSQVWRTSGVTKLTSVMDWWKFNFPASLAARARADYVSNLPLSNGPGKTSVPKYKAYFLKEMVLFLGAANAEFFPVLFSFHTFRGRDPGEVAIPWHFLWRRPTCDEVLLIPYSWLLLLTLPAQVLLHGIQT